MPRGYSLTEGRSFWVAVVLIIFLSFYLLYAQPTGFVGRTAVASAPASSLSVKVEMPTHFVGSDELDHPGFSLTGLHSQEKIEEVQLFVDGAIVSKASSGARYSDGTANFTIHSSNVPSILPDHSADGMHALEVKVKTRMGLQSRSATTRFDYFIDRTPPSTELLSVAPGEARVKITDTHSRIDIENLVVYYFDRVDKKFIRMDSIPITCQSSSAGKTAVCTILLDPTIQANMVPVIFPYDYVQEGVGNTDDYPFSLDPNVSGEELMNEEMTSLGFSEETGTADSISLSSTIPSSPVCKRSPDTIELVVFAGGPVIENQLSGGDPIQDISHGTITGNEIVYYLRSASAKLSKAYPKTFKAETLSDGTIIDFSPITRQVNITVYVPTSMVGYLCNAQGNKIADNPLPQGEEPQLCPNQKYIAFSGPGFPSVEFKLKFYTTTSYSSSGTSLVYLLPSYWSSPDPSVPPANPIFTFAAKVNPDEIVSPNHLISYKGTFVASTEEGMWSLSNKLAEMTGQKDDPQTILIVKLPTINHPWACGLARSTKGQIVMDYLCYGGKHVHEIGHLLGLADHYTNPKADPNNFMHTSGILFDSVQKKRVIFIMCSENGMPEKVGRIQPDMLNLAFNSCNNFLLDTSPDDAGNPREVCDNRFSGKRSPASFTNGKENSIKQLCVVDKDPPLAVSYEDIPSLQSAGLPVEYCTPLPYQSCKCLSSSENPNPIDTTTVATPISYVYCSPSGKCWPTDNFTEPWDTPTPSSPPAEGTAVTPEPATPVQEKPKPCGVVTPAPPADPNAPPFSTPPAPVCGGACEKSSDTCTTAMNVETNQWECGCIELNYVSPNETLIVEEIASPRERPSSESDSSGDGVAVEAIDS